MAKETTNPAPAQPMINPFGDMSLLRDIIMGPKVAEYDQALTDIQALIAKNEAATKAHFEALESETKAHFETLERDMNARFDRLEQLLLQNVDKLNQQIENTSQTDRHALADMLVEVSKKLKG